MIVILVIALLFLLLDCYCCYLTGIRGGEAPEVADLVRDRIDTELEMAKSLMQQEFEETIESEQVCLASMVYIDLPSQKYIGTVSEFTLQSENTTLPSLTHILDLQSKIYDRFSKIYTYNTMTWSNAVNLYMKVEFR